MKIIDERLGKTEVVELSQDLASFLAEILYNDYSITLGAKSSESIEKDFARALARLFDIKLK